MENPTYVTTITSEEPSICHQCAEFFSAGDTYFAFPAGEFGRGVVLCEDCVMNYEQTHGGGTRSVALS